MSKLNILKLYFGAIRGLVRGVGFFGEFVYAFTVWLRKFVRRENAKYWMLYFVFLLVCIYLLVMYFAIFHFRWF